MESREPETWRPIPGYEGLYEVSSWGNVKSVQRFVNGRWGFLKVPEKILTNSIHNLGYLKVTIFKNGLRKKLYIHRLVASVFIDFYDQYLEVNHKDRDKKNNYYKNLELTNRRENVSHYQKEDSLVKLTGVSKQGNGFVSEIRIDNKRIYLGYYDNKESAHDAYVDALKEYGLQNKYATESS